MNRSIQKCELFQRLLFFLTFLYFCGLAFNSDTVFTSKLVNHLTFSTFGYFAKLFLIQILFYSVYYVFLFSEFKLIRLFASIYFSIFVLVQFIFKEFAYTPLNPNILAVVFENIRFVPEFIAGNAQKMSVLFFKVLLLVAPVFLIRLYVKVRISVWQTFSFSVLLLVVLVILFSNDNFNKKTVPFLFSQPVLQVQYFLKSKTDLSRISVNTKSSNSISDKIILIIDESVRSDRLSINGYKNRTCPLLEKRIYEFHENKTIESLANNSLDANSILLTGVKFEKSNYLPPTLFHYAKSVGYTTVHINSQDERFPSYLIEEDKNVIDSIIVLNMVKEKWKRDTNALLSAKRIIDKYEKCFIVVNKIGCHFPYYTKYPQDWSYFKPCQSEMGLIFQNQLTVSNSYDNAIRWSVDFALNEFFKNLDSTITILYTSDHGESLGENGYYGHGFGQRCEFRVPFITWGVSVDYMVDSIKNHRGVYKYSKKLMGY